MYVASARDLLRNSLVQIYKVKNYIKDLRLSDLLYFPNYFRPLLSILRAYPLTAALNATKLVT